MVKIYYRRIKDGKMTLDDVPMQWRERVKALLEADEEVNYSDFKCVALSRSSSLLPTILKLSNANS